VKDEDEDGRWGAERREKEKERRARKEPNENWRR